MSLLSTLLLSAVLCYTLAKGNDYFNHLNCGENVLVRGTRAYYHLRDPYHYGRILKAVPGAIEERVYTNGAVGPFGPYRYPVNAARFIGGHGYAPRQRVNVQVDVAKDPGYAVLHHGYKPRTVVVEEKVKLPTVALKEKETVIVNGEREHRHRLVPRHLHGIVKDVHLGC